MIRRFRPGVLATCLLVSLLAAACGGDASFSPTGPSSVGGTGSGALITGTVTGVTAAALAAGSGSGASPGAVTVSVVGTNIASGLDSTGRFRLSGVPSGPITLQFTGGGIEATLTLNVASGERIELTVKVTATGVRIEAERRESGPDRTELDGHITSIDATARTLRVAGVLVEVPASAVIRRESQTVAFADLHVGNEVKILARLEGSRIIATDIRLEVDDDDDDGDDEDDHGDTFAEIEGLVSALTGSCPTLAFSVRTVTVRTHSATRFEDAACAHLQNGMEVHVKGQRQSDGSLLAVRLEIED